MLIAVSCLSPVSIHTLIFARWSIEIVSGTPSCSLSSTAVAPTKSRLRSISLATAASSASRFDIAVAAARYRSSHSTALASVRVFFASTRVRRPRLAKWARWRVTSSSADLSPSGRNFSNMTSSAPFESSVYGPSEPSAPFSRTRIDIFFRADENSLIACTCGEGGAG